MEDSPLGLSVSTGAFAALTCGSHNRITAENISEWDYDEHRPYVPHFLPEPLEDLSEEQEPPRRRLRRRVSTRSNGCGAVVHSRVIATARVPGVASSQGHALLGYQGIRDGLGQKVVQMDNMYFPDKLRNELGLREHESTDGVWARCRCATEGLGCAVCGNPLSVLHLYCSVEHAPTVPSALSSSSTTTQAQSIYRFLSTAVSSSPSTIQENQNQILISSSREQNRRGARTPNPYIAGPRTPNPYVDAGGRTPAWGGGSRTPNPHDVRPPWNAGPRTPNPYVDTGGRTPAWAGGRTPAWVGGRTPIPRAATPEWNTGPGSPHTYLEAGEISATWGGGSRPHALWASPNPYVDGGFGRTPPWGGGSRTPNPHADTPEWNTGPGSPNPYVDGSFGRSPTLPWGSLHTPNPHADAPEDGPDDDGASDQGAQVAMLPRREPT
ncbi:hypothetical protein K438DRAFT_1846247 [Mycena galopus ATCC 62051]|nr:hypothetical protein K438DRAFT_1846247 [Mycena galopus ATCC 62051]